MLRQFLTLFITVLILQLDAAIKNSVIPIMEKIQQINNLPTKKYSNSQYQEIIDALDLKDQRIRAVSYNMLNNLNETFLAEEYSWKKRLPRIAELIKEMKPDIIGLQELMNDQIDSLLPLLSDSLEFFSMPSTEGEINGILYNIERFEVLKTKILYMSATPNIPNPDALTMVELKDRKSGLSFSVFNAHLDFSNVNKRDFQARFIGKNVEEVAQKMPVLLLGDFNTFPNRPDLLKLPAYDGDYIHHLLTFGSLRDARTEALLGHVGPLSTFTNQNDDGIPFKGNGTPGVILDHIFVTKKITVLIHAIQSGKVNGHFPSDHMPVIIDFILKSENGARWKSHRTPNEFNDGL